MFDYQIFIKYSVRLAKFTSVKTKAQDTPLPLCMCPACLSCPLGLPPCKAKTKCKVNMIIWNGKAFCNKIGFNRHFPLSILLVSPCK